MRFSPSALAVAVQQLEKEKKEREIEMVKLQRKSFFLPKKEKVKEMGKEIPSSILNGLSLDRNAPTSNNSRDKKSSV